MPTSTMTKPKHGCRQCGATTQRRSRTYCSNQCQTDYQFRSYIARWLEGKESGKKHGGVVSGHIRRYLKEQTGNRCQDCGWSKTNRKTGLVPLEVDHIDGDHRNNAVTNLRLLCPNCHSLTDTYKALNKGNGRSRG